LFARLCQAITIQISWRRGRDRTKKLRLHPHIPFLLCL
jgi:hypothetical protein